MGNLSRYCKTISQGDCIHFTPTGNELEFYLLYILVNTCFFSIFLILDTVMVAYTDFYRYYPQCCSIVVTVVFLTWLNSYSEMYFWSYNWCVLFLNCYISTLSHCDQIIWPLQFLLFAIYFPLWSNMWLILKM